MKNTLCELHFHTLESSHCGHVSALDAIPLYKENGYDLVVVTDHYNHEYFPEYIDGTMSWKDTMERWFLGYEAALKAGKECGVTVLHGAEFRFYENHNDYLVYGMTDKMFYENSELFRMSIAEFSDFARKNGVLVFQAHPFRYGQVIQPAKYLDGLEIYNSHPLHNAHNPIAQKYAENNNLIGICGQDFHQYPAMLGCKTKIHGEISTMYELTAKLKARDFEIIKPEHPAVYTD